MWKGNCAISSPRTPLPLPNPCPPTRIRPDPTQLNPTQLNQLNSTHRNPTQPNPTQPNPTQPNPTQAPNEHKKAQKASSWKQQHDAFQQVKDYRMGGGPQGEPPDPRPCVIPIALLATSAGSPPLLYAGDNGREDNRWQCSRVACARGHSHRLPSLQQEIL